MTELHNLRVQIDTLDKELIGLLSQRVKLAVKVGEFKAIHGLPPLDPVRWQAVLANRIALGQEAGVSERLIAEIFNAIHEDSKAIQKEIIQ